MTYRFRFEKKELLIIATSLLFSFSFTTSPFNFFIYFAFLPLIRLIESSKNNFEAFRNGYLVGLIFNSILVFWVINYKFNSYLLLILLNPIQFGIFSYSYSNFKILDQKIRIVIFPFLWTGLEYAREFGDLALNWINIGYTQGNYLNIIQFADIFGLNGITFWICLVNLVLYNIIFKIFNIKRYWLNYLILVMMFIFPFLYGIDKLSERETKQGIIAAYIQPNIDSKAKWEKSKLENNFNLLFESNKHLLMEKYNLVIWPETAVPISIQELQNSKKYLSKFESLNYTNILTGILYDTTISNIKIKHNSAVLIKNNSNLKQIYHKIILVPFVEQLPFSQIYDFAIPVNILSNYYSQGKETTIFETELKIYSADFEDDNWRYTENSENISPIKFSTIICFESSFPSFVREFILNGAEFLVVITNDEWFGYSAQPVQHLLTSRFRAIENRRSVIHNSNAGISSFIDNYGRFYGETKLLSKENSIQFVPINKEYSFFTTFGDIIGKLCLTFILITFMLIFYKRIKQK